jgi:hypothetical protein
VGDWHGEDEVLRDADEHPMVGDLAGHCLLPSFDANKRLIAAAPELLAALKVLLDQVHPDCLREGEEIAVDAAYDLIARVEGGE